MHECEKCKLPTDYDSIDNLCHTCAELKDEGPQSSQSQPKPTPCMCASGVVTAKLMIQCVECVRWWHPGCVGLDGLSKYGCNSIVNWRCPICFKFSSTVKEKIGIELEVSDDSRDESITIKAAVKAEVMAIVPTVVDEVVAGVKSALSENNVQQMVKDANEIYTKSWADVAKQDQKKVIKEVVEQTSGTALEKSLGRISADLSSQMNRVRNCVLSGVKEGQGGDDSSLAQVVAAAANGKFTTDDIAHCKRLGEKKPGTNRIILVVFKKEEIATEFHNYGRGRKLQTQGVVWVNPDLTQTERTARFNMRQERRRKDNNRPPVRDTARARENSDGAQGENGQANLQANLSNTD